MTLFEEFPVANENVSVSQKRKSASKNAIFMGFLLIHILLSAIAGSPLQCWDQSTRGLDSATSLEFVRTLRISTESTKATVIVTLYQVSQSIYDVSLTARALLRY